ncbi:MAG: metallophosphoesterase [Vicinamibacterales bacterium]
MSHRFLIVWMVVSLLCGVLLPVAPDIHAQSGPQRVVAIGDIHGAEENLVALLQTAGLIDQQRKWTGGRARLVQTGDFTDRGAPVRHVMDLLMRLEDEARRAGGRVEVLLGNHEGMNILRDLRDVSPDAFGSFTNADSEARRNKAFMAHATIARRFGEELNRNEWLRTHPAGYVEYIEALGPSGRYGRWLRSRKVVTKVDDSLFMHAGLSPQSNATVDDVNRMVEREIRTYDEAVSTLQQAGLIAPSFTLQEIVAALSSELNRIAAMLKEKKELSPEITQEYVGRLQRVITIDKWGMLAADGPLWFRGYATLGEDALPQIEALLKRLGAARFIVGHTPQIPGSISARFGNRIFLIDTGMLTSHFKGGRPSALEIAGGKITAIYPDQRIPLAD